MPETPNKQTQDLELSRRALSLDTNSYREVDGQPYVDVVFVTETPVLTRDCDYQPIYEVLSCNPSHVRMDRFNNGAPALDAHDKYSGVRGILGRVTEPKFVSKEGRAAVKLSRRKELEGFRQDVKDGVVGNTSVGYRVFAYEDISKRDDKIRTLKAVDWEPYEVSFLGVQADYRSQVRSADYSNSTQTNNMPPEEPTSQAQAAAPAAPAPAAPAPVPAAPAEGQRAAGQVQVPGTVVSAADPVIQERQRAEAIEGIVSFAKLDDVFRKRMINEGHSVDKVRELVFAEMQRVQTAAAPASTNVQTAGHVGNTGEKALLIRGIEEAISCRAFDIAPETDYGKGATELSLVGHVRNLLIATGTPQSEVNRLGDMELANRALSSTDYPLALANVMNKKLKAAYTAVAPQWKKFATKVPANDFKNLYNVRVDGSFLPVEMAEDGEYKFAAFKETGDNFALKTWGRAVAFTRKMMINDDLSAFTRVAPAFANGFMRKQAEIVYGLLTANSGAGRLLPDGYNLFDTTNHKNLAATPAVMSLTTFSLADTAMMLQTGLDGQLISVRPKYLVVPPKLSTLAAQLVNSTILPNTTAQANPFYGKYEVIVEPYLGDSTAWYIISDPSEIDIIIWATLAGQEGIFADQQYNWKTDALEFKFRNDFNATIQEYRGIYKNAGA